MSNAKQCNRCGKYYDLIPENLPGTKTGPKYDGGKDISTLKFDTDPNNKPFAYSLTKLTDMFATNPVEMAGILKDCRSIDVYIDGVIDDKYFLIEDLIDPNKSNVEISDFFKHKYTNIMNKEEK